MSDATQDRFPHFNAMVKSGACFGATHKIIVRIFFDRTRRLRPAWDRDRKLQEDNFRHICFGSGTETCSAGVAILLHERHAKNVASAKVISDRVMYVDLTVGGWKLRSIAAYAPHAGYSDDALNAFFELVHVAVMGACREGKQSLVEISTCNFRSGIVGPK